MWEPVSALTHGTWALASIPAAYLLIKRANSSAQKNTLFVFSITAFFCFAASFLYHATLAPFFRIVDYTCIFLFIAGTYTPVIWNYISATSRVRSLVLIWLLTVIAIIINIFVGPLLAYRGFELIYIIYGWFMILLTLELIQFLRKRVSILILLGGLAYTIGAILEFLRLPTKPIIFGLFGHHEIFHLWVMLGSAFHYFFMLTMTNPVLSQKSTPVDNYNYCYIGK